MLHPHLPSLPFSRVSNLPSPCPNLLLALDLISRSLQILHVLTASLSHAKPLLAAAINAGFRESGVQSLKNLDDPRACPMVAVRTAGLGVEAVIGATLPEGGDGEGTSDGEITAQQMQHLVSRDYRLLLLRLANQRFAANEERIQRFRRCLREAMSLEGAVLQRRSEYEDPVERRERKRREGLRERDEKQMERTREKEEETAKKLKGGSFSKTLKHVSDDPRLDEDGLGGIGIPDVGLFSTR